MALTAGSRLGHYDVTALIDEGGMGQLYQATDTKLNRQVALKILTEAFATDTEPDRLVRFQREAQVLASLNHPEWFMPGISAGRGLRTPVHDLLQAVSTAVAQLRTHEQQGLTQFRGLRCQRRRISGQSLTSSNRRYSRRRGERQ